MWHNFRRYRFPGWLITLAFSVAAMLALPTPVSCQMYNNQTLYTDADMSGKIIHAWGYTYAPSGNSIIHRYVARTRIVLPGGISAENINFGNGFTPANVHVFLTVSDDDLANDRIPEGSVSLSTEHQAYCPMNLGGTVPFLSTITSVAAFWAVSVFRWTGVSTVDLSKGTIACVGVPACTNTSSPRCGSGGSVMIRGYPEEPCCQYWKSFYLRVGSVCSPGASSPTCQGGPGTCTT
jgi:hypothetical protein